MHAGDVIGGRYLLDRPLGEGGMKTVWRGYDQQTQQFVAVALLFDFEPTRFLREIDLARRVDSPHVARVLDGFVDAGRGIIVSEHCSGRDLARLVRDAPLRVAEAVRFAHEMALGVVAIHRAHVLHRDVKPANAILTGDGVRMIDFGVSLPAADDKTGADGAAPAGTLAFMAPECFGGDVDARADTYALGVSLFQLVTGRLPLEASTPWELLRRMHQRVALPLDGLAGHDPRVTAMVVRLCALDVADRPYLADVEPALGELARALAAESTVVPRPLHALGPAGPLAPLGPLGVADPTFQPHLHAPIAPTMYPAPERIPLRVPHPGRVIVGWPHLPILGLTPIGTRTRIVGFTAAGLERWAALVDDELVGGLVADVDGDGVDELYAWSATRIHVIDAVGRVRLLATLPPPPPVPDLAPDPSGRHRTHRSRPVVAGAPMPWDRGPLAPIVLDGPNRTRHLAAAGQRIDVVTGEVTALPARFQGDGAALVDAPGLAGFSCHGGARQCFRGDVATPAAILTRRGLPGFLVASLERGFDGGPTVGLGLWGPGGHRVGGGRVGKYSFETAPLEVFLDAQRPETALFGPEVAPLAALGANPADDTVVVPYLINAPWFGPVLVAFDVAGAERWRTKVPPVGRALAAPPMMLVSDGGTPEVLWGDGAKIRRYLVRDGRELTPLDSAGVPIAALDPDGRGLVRLVVWTPDGVELHTRGSCLPGAVVCLPGRGDLWRTGTIGPDGLPVGPRR